MGERGDGGRGADPSRGGSSRSIPAPVPVEPFDRFPELACLHSERAGGSSEGPFRSLNLGLLTPDDPGRVRENRRRWFAACGIPTERVVSPHQVHGAVVLRVAARDAGRGALDLESATRGDGLWTDEPGLALLAVSADCVLVALYEPQRRIAAVFHAGWRGAAAGIAGRAVSAIEDAGARRERIWAGMAPAIGPCCYQVGTEVAGALRARRPDGAWLIPDGDRFRIDLYRFISEDLAGAGIRAARIGAPQRCTACDADRLYSHRRDGERAGRIGLLIAMRR